MNNPLAIILALALPTAALSTPVALYTPGGSPCAGACTQSWAEQVFDVPSGDPVPLTIPKGSYSHAMSYAKDGVPMVDGSAMVFADDEPGIGYPLGDGRWMVRVDACLNWAVVSMPETSQEAVAAPPVTLASLTPPTAGTIIPPQHWTPYPVPWTPTAPVVPVDPAPPVEPPPAPVPLPATGWLLLAALGIALIWRRSI